MRSRSCSCCFFFNDTATTEIYTLSLHDALPIYGVRRAERLVHEHHGRVRGQGAGDADALLLPTGELTRVARAEVARVETHDVRSEEQTSELQSRQYLVCRLLLEKKTRL